MKLEHEPLKSSRSTVSDFFFFLFPYGDLLVQKEFSNSCDNALLNKSGCSRSHLKMMFWKPSN